MVFAILSGSASSGGRYIPSNPTATHTGTGQFTITNYLGYQEYILSNTSTANRTENIVTLSNSNDNTTIHAAPPKLGVTSASPVYVERKEYTYNVPYTVYVQTGFDVIPAPCPAGWTCYGDCSSGTCGKSYGYEDPRCCLKDPTPSGYSDEYGEWAKIV